MPDDAPFNPAMFIPTLSLQRRSMGFARLHSHRNGGKGARPVRTAALPSVQYVDKFDRRCRWERALKTLYIKPQLSILCVYHTTKHRDKSTREKRKGETLQNLKNIPLRRQGNRNEGSWWEELLENQNLFLVKKRKSLIQQYKININQFYNITREYIYI